MMNINIQQLKIFIAALRHLIRSENKRLKVIEDAQTKVIFSYYQLGRSAPDPDEKRTLFSQAEKEESWLDGILADWHYQKFYLEELLLHLQTKLREIQKMRGRHEIAA